MKSKFPYSFLSASVLFFGSICAFAAADPRMACQINSCKAVAPDGRVAAPQLICDAFPGQVLLVPAVSAPGATGSKNAELTLSGPNGESRYRVRYTVARDGSYQFGPALDANENELKDSVGIYGHFSALPAAESRLMIHALAMGISYAEFSLSCAVAN